MRQTFRRRRGFVIGALVCLVAVPLAAQSVAPLAIVTMLRVLQRQVDTLQARLDGSGELYMRATIDYVALGASGAAVIGGWGFACGEPDGGQLVIMVDGVQSAQANPANFFRWDRADVSAAYAGFCPMAGAQAGFQTAVDMGVFGSGPHSDGWHEVIVRVYDRTGRKWDSPPRQFNTGTGSFQ